MRFDLTDLRLFLLVLEHGSITHGAAHAHLSLPSASARLRGMEATLGQALLERNRRGVAATAAGDTLAHHARLVLRQIERLDDELGAHAQGAQTTIRLWANTAALSEFLPQALAPFLAKHPRVVLDTRERPSTAIVKGVLGGMAELGIVSDAVDAGALHTYAYATDRLVVIAPRNHPLAVRRSVTLPELAGQAWVGLSAGSPWQDFLDEQALLAGQALPMRARVRSFEAICQMVEQGVGLGIVPRTAVQRYRGARGLRAIALAHAWAQRELRICVKQPETLSHPARALLEHLRGAAGAKDNWKRIL